MQLDFMEAHGIQIPLLDLLRFIRNQYVISHLKLPLNTNKNKFGTNTRIKIFLLKKVRAAC